MTWPAGSSNRPRSALRWPGSRRRSTTGNRLPMRVRELARIVIAHDNECEVCVNTRDADGPTAGVDEELDAHALEWRTWPGFTDQERIAAEFAHRFATEHTKLRDDEDFWERCRGALLRRAARGPGAVLCDVDRHGPYVAHPRHRAELQDHLAQPRLTLVSTALSAPRGSAGRGAHRCLRRAGGSPHR